MAASTSARFGVDLDPDTEVLPLLGGKEGVAHICWSMLDPGDVCLAADPGYPVYTSGPLLAGAEPVLMPLRAEQRVPARPGGDPGATSRDRANLLFCNYPNNPTGAVVDDDFFERLARFGLDNGIPIVHDNAYSEITFDGYVAGSFLQAPGASEAGVEMFSLSKSFNMTGWRVGAAVGNAEMLGAALEAEDERRLGHVRRPSRWRRSRALAEGDGFAREMCEVYRRRRDLADRGARGRRHRGRRRRGARCTSGCRCRRPHVGVVRRARARAGGRRRLAGVAYGPNGEGYVRLSLTLPDDRLREAVGRIEQHLRVPA